MILYYLLVLAVFLIKCGQESNSEFFFPKGMEEGKYIYAFKLRHFVGKFSLKD